MCSIHSVTEEYFVAFSNFSVLNTSKNNIFKVAAEHGVVVWTSVFSVHGQTGGGSIPDTLASLESIFGIFNKF